MSIDERIKSTPLPRKSKLTAQYIADNKLEVAYAPASSVAKNISVSDVTVHRVAKQLGFDSFGDMQESIRSEIQEQIEHKGADPLGDDVYERMCRHNSEIKNTADVIGAERRLAWEHIRQAAADMSPETVDAAAAAILKARKLYVIGFWTAATFAEYFSIKMHYNLDNIITITNQSPTALTHTLDIGAKDCVVIYSYGKDVKMLKLLAKNAKAAGATVVGIIDCVTSAIAPYTDHSFVADTDGLSFTSQIGTLFVTEVLLTAIIRKIWAKRQNYNAKLQKLLKEMNYYI